LCVVWFVLIVLVVLFGFGGLLVALLVCVWYATFVFVVFIANIAVVYLFNVELCYIVVVIYSYSIL